MKYDELSPNRMMAYDASKKVGGKSYKAYGNDKIRYFVFQSHNIRFSANRLNEGLFETIIDMMD